MRKTFFVILMVIILAASGCGSEQVCIDADYAVPHENSTSLPIETTANSTEGANTKSELTYSVDPADTSAPKETTDSTANTEPATESAATESPNVESSPESKTKPTSPSESDYGESTTPSITKTDPPTTSAPETDKALESQWSPKVYASARNAQEISLLVEKYLNDYRTVQGSQAALHLSGLTSYAEFRSVQLVSNFAHDTDDERAAATALQYGRYIDPSLYGISGEPYYTSEAREAIAFTGKVGSVDEVASHIATMIRNSAGHWAYVGDSEYIYIGVGITYESGYWYCDIALSKVNNG